MISIAVDTAKITKLQEKFAKYPPYAQKAGLKASADWLNAPEFKSSMYAPDRNGSPFQWSSDKQRHFVFATVDLPYSRTGGLANAGEFRINEQSYWVEYFNSLPWWIYVLHPSYQIVGHRARGWKPVNQQVVAVSGKIVPIFKRAALDAWQTLDSFMYGGGAGL